MIGYYGLQIELYFFFGVLQASSVNASVRGLKGCKTLNKDPDPKNPIEGKEDRLVFVYIFFVFIN